MPNRIQIAVVDYNLGNLFSVKHACEFVGMRCTISSDKDDILLSDGVILPGVGSFGDAMRYLNKLDLVHPLRDIAAAGKPFMGICLGLQLLMEKSYEFGSHEGLGILAGEVIRFEKPKQGKNILKVPHMGWNRIFRSCNGKGELKASDPWTDTPLEGLSEGSYLYFVHSFYARPEFPGTEISYSIYGGQRFCSSIRYGNLFACQFHPERSGPAGLKIYKNFFKLVKEYKQ